MFMIPFTISTDVLVILLENREEMFPRYCMHSDILRMFKSSITQGVNKFNDTHTHTHWEICMYMCEPGYVTIRLLFPFYLWSRVINVISNTFYFPIICFYCNKMSLLFTERAINHLYNSHLCCKNIIFVIYAGLFLQKYFTVCETSTVHGNVLKTRKHTKKNLCGEQYIYI